MSHPEPTHDSENELPEDIEDIENEEKICELCGGTGYIEIMGDGANFEWDVIGTRPCKCQEEE